MAIKYNKYSRYLEAYVDSIKDLVDLNLIIRISGYRNPPRGRKILREGTTIPVRNKYAITVRMFEKQINGEIVRYVPQFLFIVLDTLAHELAHVQHLDHSVDHYKLQLKIMRRFVKILKKKQITDTSCRIVFEE